MKTKQQKTKFIEMLRKTPIIQVVCERTGISRTTYYRWKETDRKFSQVADEALAEGVDLINDMTVSQLISSIKDKKIAAIIYWLSHRHPDFAPADRFPKKEFRQELTYEEKKSLQRAIDLTPHDSTEISAIQQKIEKDAEEKSDIYMQRVREPINKENDFE